MSLHIAISFIITLQLIGQTVPKTKSLWVQRLMLDTHPFELKVTFSELCPLSDTIESTQYNLIYLPNFHNEPELTIFIILHTVLCKMIHIVDSG